MVKIDQREIAAYNAGHAARAGVDRPTAPSWLGLFRMWMGLQPIGSAFCGRFQRDDAEFWISTRQGVCRAPLRRAPAPIKAYPCHPAKGL